MCEVCKNPSDYAIMTRADGYHDEWTLYQSGLNIDQTNSEVNELLLSQETRLENIRIFRMTEIGFTVGIIIK